MILEFFVYGEPATAGSKRGIPIYRGKKGQPREFTGKVAIVADSHKEAAGRGWRSAVQAAALQALAGGQPFPKGLALRVRLTFVLPRPASASVRRRPFPSVMPDVDKLSRLALDSLKHVAWADDGQVVTKFAAKRYVDPSQPELSRVGCRVSIEPEEAPVAALGSGAAEVALPAQRALPVA